MKLVQETGLKVDFRNEGREILCTAPGKLVVFVSSIFVSFPFLFDNYLFIFLCEVYLCCYKDKTIPSYGLLALVKLKPSPHSQTEFGDSQSQACSKLTPNFLTTSDSGGGAALTCLRL